jgi:hypothetical protein
MLMALFHPIRVAMFAFWPVWIPMTAAAAICVAWFVGWRGSPTAQKVSVNFTRAGRQVASRGAVAARTLLAFFLVGYIAMILAWENFAYHDNSIFTLITLRGDDIGVPIIPGLGRFFPLGFQEFNLIRHLTYTITGYHTLRIAELLIFSWILLVLDEDLSISARAALAAVALITPSILISFSWLIYHEANVLLGVVCLALFVRHFERNKSVGWAVAAAVCAQIMIYYKETASLLLIGFAVSRLVLRCRSADATGWDYSRLWDKESRLDVCLATLAVLFWLYYLGVMFPHPNLQYADDLRQPFAELLLGYIKADLLALLLVGAVLSRTYLILRYKVTPSLLWDGLAFGGIACFIGYLGLGISAAYYLAPVDLIAVLYVGRFAILSVRMMNSWNKLAALAIFVAVVLQDVSLSAFRVFEQKSVIHAKGEIAQVVQAQYQNVTANIRRLFFPFASPYMIMEFASYLDYRGVPVQGIIDEAGEPGGLIVVTRKMTKNGPCVGYRTLICHAATTPDSGDLVIVLPDDNASLAEVAPYREKADVLFSHEPHVPKWLYPFIRVLRVASPGPLIQKDLSDGWLYGSVTTWK